MAPLTRQRAGKGNTATPLMAKYYKQRATTGLIIAEGSQISQQAVGYEDTPGIYSDEQVKAWKKITRAVHQSGGKIFLQLWHVGRHSHPDFQPDGKLPVAPTAVKEDGQVRTKTGKRDAVIPHALEEEEIKQIIEDYKKATINAKLAGFDGVEIHAANGYLIDQFLQNGTNKRTDRYGGAVENRSRFLLEVTEAACKAWDHGRVGVRLSPSGLHAGISDSDPVSIFSHAIKKLNDFNLAYLHLVEPMMPVGHLPHYLKEVAPYYRKIYKGNIISCGGYNPKTAEKAIREGVADVIAFGRLFISNPDLVEWIRRGGPYNEWDEKTFYGGGEKGYTDYPFLEEDVDRLKMRYCCKR